MQEKSQDFHISASSRVVFYNRLMQSSEKLDLP